jgi:hypothetical protein
VLPLVNSRLMTLPRLSVLVTAPWLSVVERPRLFPTGARGRAKDWMSEAERATALWKRGPREDGRSGLVRPRREESYKEKTNVIRRDIGGR